MTAHNNAPTRDALIEQCLARGDWSHARIADELGVTDVEVQAAVQRINAAEDGLILREQIRSRLRRGLKPSWIMSALHVPYKLVYEVRHEDER